MIYTLERRHEFEYGTMSTHWEIRSYTHKTPIGILMNGNTLKKEQRHSAKNIVERKI